MKPRLFVLLAASLALAFACETPENPTPDPDPQPPKPQINVSKESEAIFSSGISFPQGTGAQKASLSFTTTEAWSTDITDTKASSWLSVQPSSGGAGTVNMTVTAQPNTETKERSSTVTIKCGTVSKSFTVKQAAAPETHKEVTSVTLNKTSLSLTKGQSETLTATVSPADATDKNVSWSSSDATIASVDAYGKVTALKSGSATITAKAGEKQATCAVTVTTPAESISLDRTSVSLEEGQSTTLIATVSPADADDKTVTWSTSNSAVATVSGGVVTAVKEGTATITAKAGSLSATCQVTVQKNVVPVSSVTLNKTSLSLTKGQSETLTATVSPADATDKNVSWSSSDATIASVDTYGKVTALKSGNATITAKAGEKQATCAVTVTTPAESISLDRTSVSLEEGQSTTLIATVSPADADDKSVTWSTSDGTVATVSGGTVTAVKEGSATITAKAGSLTATCQVEVKKYVFELNPNQIQIAASVSTFTVTVNTSHSYHINSKPDWITEKSVSNKVHTFEAEANPSSEKRSGVIVFCDDTGTCLPCNITQDGAGPFEITPSTVELPGAGGQFEVTVSCSTTYHINSKPDWVEEVSLSGKVHVFKVGKNPSEQDRSGVIVFCDDKGVCLPCNVKQKGSVPDTTSGGNEDVNDGNPINW